jgi:hypothetical protein
VVAMKKRVFSDGKNLWRPKNNKSPRGNNRKFTFNNLPKSHDTIAAACICIAMFSRWRRW